MKTFCLTLVWLPKLIKLIMLENVMKGHTCSFVRNRITVQTLRFISLVMADAFIEWWLYIFTIGQKIYKALFRNRPAERNELFQPGRMVKSIHFTVFLLFDHRWWTFIYWKFFIPKTVSEHITRYTLAELLWFQGDR